MKPSAGWSSTSSSTGGSRRRATAVRDRADAAVCRSVGSATAGRGSGHLAHRDEDGEDVAEQENSRTDLIGARMLGAADELIGADAEVVDDVVRVPYDAATVTSAPAVGGAGHLNVDDEAQLYLHYGLDPWEQGAKSGGRTGGSPTGIPLAPHSDAGPRGHDGGDDGAVV